MERVVGTLFALTVCTSSLCAWGESKPRTDSRTFLRIADTDGDARVSAAELNGLVLSHVRDQVARRFTRLDRNRDGRVVRDEVPKMAAARFSRFDLDKDDSFTAAELGHVMREQALRRCETLIVRLDMDGDGVVTQLDLDQSADTRLVKLDAALLDNAAATAK